MSDTVLSAAQSRVFPGDIEASLSEHIRLIRASAEFGAQLVIFPELSLTGYTRSLTTDDLINSDDSRFNDVRGEVRRCNLVAVVGVPVASDNKLFIATYSFHPDGHVSTYTKQYLGSGEEIAFSRGSGGELIRVGSQQVGLAICAEVKHPDHVINTVDRGATVYAAGSFITPEGYPEECELLQSYAVEHNIVTLIANSGGASGGFESAGRSTIWAPSGEQLASGPSQGSAIVVARQDGNLWRGECQSLTE